MGCYLMWVGSLLPAFQDSPLVTPLGTNRLSPIHQQLTTILCHITSLMNEGHSYTAAEAFNLTNLIYRLPITAVLHV